jgi:hypothetical protein
MSDSTWFNREKVRKKDRDRRRDSEHCYKKLLHGNISTAIYLVQKKIEETLYKVDVRANFSSIEVFVSHQHRKIEDLLNLHFRLRACHNGIFLMYGARLKAQSNSPSTDSIVLYSKPKWISDHAQEDTVMEWIEKTATLSIESLELTEYEAEVEMNKSTDFAATNQLWFCHLCRSLLRFLHLM